MITHKLIIREFQWDPYRTTMDTDSSFRGYKSMYDYEV